MGKLIGAALLLGAIAWQVKKQRLAAARVRSAPPTAGQGELRTMASGNSALAEEDDTAQYLAQHGLNRVNFAQRKPAGFVDREIEGGTSLPSNTIE